MIAKPRETYRAYRIAPGDSNKMVLLFDPITDRTNFVAIVEIFDVGGRTPPNMHETGQEMFYVLKGEGRAHGNGEPIGFRTGDSLLSPPGTWHEIENTGKERLYCLTVMVPNDGFAELILAGESVPIDDADWAVIGGLGVHATGRLA